MSIENPTTAEEYKARDIARHAEMLARDLRETADKIQQVVAQDLGRVGTPGIETYGEIVADIQRKLLSTLAASTLTLLVQDAAQADTYRAKGQ